MHIACIDENGFPCVRGVDYAEDDDMNLYFITHKMTRKVGQIRNNEQIAFAIDHDCLNFEELQKLKYIKGRGVAKEITNPEDMQKAFGLIMQKFPYLENLPGEPTDFTAFKVELNEVLVTDNTISFGHTELMEK
jgi:nitroimidazol reductase NimA-like FMN-containing flavoprotein (pyridoxamine 5'-phosphate oxidase superfamily)